MLGISQKESIRVERDRQILEAVRRLSQLNSLKREVNWLSQRIAEMRQAAQGGVARITGMPMGGRWRDRSGEYAGKIADLSALLDARRGRCMDEIGRLYRFIDDVPSSEMREILSYRYIEEMTWSQVAIRMGYSGEQIPRKLHNAYLRTRLESGERFFEEAEICTKNTERM